MSESRWSNSKSLAKIASGGEISRVMLALKSTWADFDNCPVLIFDEVDAGIGGKNSREHWKETESTLKQASGSLYYTSPTDCFDGKCSFSIEKAQRNGRAYVEVKELSGQERLREIARMLSGKITDSSMKHAKELLELTA